MSFRHTFIICRNLLSFFCLTITYWDFWPWYFSVTNLYMKSLFFELWKGRFVHNFSNFETSQNPLFSVTARSVLYSFMKWPFTCMHKGGPGRSRKSKLTLERRSQKSPQAQWGRGRGSLREQAQPGRWRGDRDSNSQGRCLSRAWGGVQKQRSGGFLWCMWASLGHSQVRARRGPCGRASFITPVLGAACFLRLLVLHPSPISPGPVLSFLSVVPARLSFDPYQSWLLSCKGVLAGQFSEFTEAWLLQPLHMSLWAACTQAVLAGRLDGIAHRFSAFRWLACWLCRTSVVRCFLLTQPAQGGTLLIPCRPYSSS